MARILAVLKNEPAVVIYALNAAVVLAVSFGLNLTHSQEAAVVTIATAVLGAAAAVMTRPVAVSALTGALATALAAAGTFGLHLTSSQIGAVTAVVSVVLMHVLRQSVSPASGE